MNIQTKKGLIIAGGITVCVALAVLIGSRFTSEKVSDKPDEAQGTQSDDVYVDDSSDSDLAIVPPEISDATDTNNGANSTGTNQTIQGDTTKPEYSDDQLKDSTQTPDGKTVTTTPTPVDHDQVSTPQPSAQPQGGETSNGQIYVPGFGWMDTTGGGTVVVDVGSDGDIDKQVGDMG